jgi:hypothetical protein
LSERCLVAQQLPELHDLGGARRRLVEARQVVEDPDAVLHGGRSLLVGHQVGPSQDQLVVGEGLAERAGGGCLARRGHAVLDDLFGLPGLVGVMGEAGELDLRLLGELGEDAPVVGDPCGGRQLLLDGAAGELVPEPDVTRVGLQDAVALRPRPAPRYVRRAGARPASARPGRGWWTAARATVACRHRAP